MKNFFVCRMNEFGAQEYYTNCGIYGTATWTYNDDPGSFGGATLYTERGAKMLAKKLGGYVEKKQ